LTKKLALLAVLIRFTDYSLVTYFLCHPVHVNVIKIHTNTIKNVM